MLTAMHSFPYELRAAISAAGITPHAFAIAIGYTNSGRVTNMLKGVSRFPEERLQRALVALKLSAEDRREAFMRALLVDYVPAPVRPELERTFKESDSLRRRLDEARKKTAALASDNEQLRARNEQLRAALRAQLGQSPE